MRAARVVGLPVEYLRVTAPAAARQPTKRARYRSSSGDGGGAAPHRWACALIARREHEVRALEVAVAQMLHPRAERRAPGLHRANAARRDRRVLRRHGVPPYPLERAMKPRRAAAPEHRGVRRRVRDPFERAAAPQRAVQAPQRGARGARLRDRQRRVRVARRGRGTQVL